jgi:hypothetical protein
VEIKFQDAIDAISSDLRLLDGMEAHKGLPQNSQILIHWSISTQPVQHAGVVLQQLQDGQHNVVDVAEARRLGLLGVV